jgi:hypothetical protein
MQTITTPLKNTQLLDSNKEPDIKPDMDLVQILTTLCFQYLFNHTRTGHHTSLITKKSRGIPGLFIDNKIN